PRIIFTEHGREHHDPPLQQKLDRWASAVTDVVVTVSNRLARYMAHTVGIEAGKIVTIENSVDREVFHPGAAPLELRQKLDLPADAVVIGTVGRLELVKGYDRLLPAFKEAVAAEAKGQPLVLIFCGDGSQRD